MATHEPPPPGRPLSPAEITEVLHLAVPAYLATLDPAGFPRILPIWFLWEGGSFYLSSGPQSRHVQDLARDPRAGLTVAVQEEQTPMGYRPFRQVMVRGNAHVVLDTDAAWAQKLIRKYIAGDEAAQRAQRAQREAGNAPVVIVLRPERFRTTGFFPRG